MSVARVMNEHIRWQHVVPTQQHYLHAGGIEELTIMREYYFGSCELKESTHECTHFCNITWSF